MRLEGIRKNSILWLYIFAGTEIIAFTLFMTWGWKVAATIVYFLAGIGVAILPILFRPNSNISLFKARNKRWFWMFLALFVIAAVYYVANIHPHLLVSKISIKYADMLPVIDVLSTRFINDQPIYAPIPEVWNNFQPKYLPMMWLAFVPGQTLGTDLRWTTIVFTLIGLFATLKLYRSNKITPASLFTGGLIFLLFAYIIHVDIHFFLLTQEGVILTYYLFLGLSLLTRNYYLQGIAIAVCLLSRYSFSFWIPMYGLFVLLVFGIKPFIKLVGSSILTVGFIMFISDAYKEIDVFLSLQGNYLRKINDPANKSKMYPMIVNSLGIAKFFGFSDLYKLHYSMLVMSIATPFTIGFLTWIKKNKWNLQFFGICSLKLSLVVFFNTLPLPFLYLFYSSTFLTFIVLHYYANSHLLQTANEPK